MKITGQKQWRRCQMISLDIALQYWEKGWNVVPFKFTWVEEDNKFSKKPVGEWKDFQTRRQTKQDVEKLFSVVEGGFEGIGVVTGAVSGLTVIDVDSYKGESGLNIDSGLVAKTINGGSHYYFKYKDLGGDKTQVGSHRNIDIRSGGLIVIPPSGVGDKKYEWVKKCAKADLPELPEEILKLISIPKQSLARESSYGLTEYRNPTLHDRLVSFMDHKPSNKTKDSWRKECWDWLVEANNTCQPPKGESELRTIFKSVEKFLDSKVEEGRSNITFYSTRTVEEITTFAPRAYYPLGLEVMDRDFGFPPGFYVICGHPGSGKGFLATFLARRFFERHALRSVLFSLEMGETLVKKRILQQWSDLTEAQLDAGGDTSYAVRMMQDDAIAIYEFGRNNPEYITPDNFENDVKFFYDKGFRIFMFDHLHEIPGANVNDTNQKVTEDWGKRFEEIKKNYPDIWLIIFAQPNGEAIKKKILGRGDMSGSKSISHKCDYFLSINRKIKKNEEGDMVFDAENRDVLLYLDKGRDITRSYFGEELYFETTGNYISKVKSFY